MLDSAPSHGSAALLWLLLVVPASAEVTLSGHALARVDSTESPVSWRAGGLGRLATGTEDGDARSLWSGQAHVVLDGRWASDGDGLLGATWLGATLHTVARAEPDAEGGRSLGVVEAYLDAAWDVGTADRLGLRLGHFILDTSFENLEPAWASPYSSTFSALNSWIAEEIRPTGAQLTYERAAGEIDTWTLSAAGFGGDDTAGTLLAWRGWSFGDRLSVFGERLPLPPLPGLEDGRGFSAQRDDGTQPFGSDLDGRVGWTTTLGWRRPESMSVRATAYDNRGDRDLHGPPGEQEYGWRTRFGLLGADVHQGSWTFAAEWMWGSTGMGEIDGPRVQADFETTYVLASWTRGAWRVTGRYDTFDTVDRDASSPYDPNDGEGHAWLAALLWEPEAAPLRLAIEFLDVDAERPVAGFLGMDPNVGGRSVSIEVRAFLDGLVGMP